MAVIKVNLKGGTLVQEGERVLEITGAKATPSGKPNKITLNMKDVEDGGTLLSSYNLDNDTGVWALGVMLNIALGIEDGGEFDTRDLDRLIGVRLLCEIAHSEYNEKTYANVKRVISKVETTPVAKPKKVVAMDDDLA